MRARILLMALSWLMPVLVQAEPTRVVTADGAITETVYRLGMESLLVAVDTTSGFPEETQSLPKIGYLRALPFEGVLAMRPDVLITSEQAAPQDNLDRLVKAGVQVETLPMAWTPEASLERIVAVGDILHARPQAEALVTELSSKISRVQQDAANRVKRPRVLFILAAGNHSVMLAGQGTAASALLDTVNADNAVTAIQGYKPASREAILASQPDAIVIAESTPGQFDINKWQELAHLDAWKSGHHMVADSMLLLGFGPRLPEAMDALNRVLPSGSAVVNDDS
ncbi:heme/hemin ABC transporter substrate-binding protein [Marinobacter sp.]|uniref:heme/hemin ABC transporter substrate-binding protein n=1 Tax=Marinobacter sp. TaxID=50741 RepID=UPI002B26C35C|nr:ABC transporter substrate-binding protein [Marinobacter sp.]